MLVTILVAAVVIYQVLANDIREHITEYATLKAMGHTNGFLSGVVVTQAMIYSLAAYVPAVVAGRGPLPRDRGPGEHPDAADGRPTSASCWC